jgi:hypothetical protein
MFGEFIENLHNAPISCAPICKLQLIQIKFLFFLKSSFSFQFLHCTMTVQIVQCTICTVYTQGVILDGQTQIFPPG